MYRPEYFIRSVGVAVELLRYESLIAMLDNLLSLYKEAGE
jgi:hypothetical protein